MTQDEQIKDLVFQIEELKSKVFNMEQSWNFQLSYPLDPISEKIISDIALKYTRIIVGSGVPTATADTGSIYLRTDGGASTSIYIKESGSGTGNGWVAK